MKRKQVVSLILSMALVLTALFTGCAGEEQPKHPLAETSQEPESEGAFSNLNHFEAETLDGAAFTQDNLSDKDVTVINFWSVTCGPCIAEMPALARLSESLPDNVQVLTVCLDGGDYQEDASGILSQAGFQGITLLSGDGDFEKVCREIQYTPTTIFVDKDGNTSSEVIIGGQEDLAESYTDAINSILKSKGKEKISVEKD